MSSATTFSASSEVTRVFLDANIIAKPVTRTLLVVGGGAERFGGTKGADRQILADTAAAGARFLITEDVDDYGLDDLASVGVSAVNPDLFLAERLTRDAYSTVIDLFVERQLYPPTVAAQLHAAIAKQHPRPECR